MNDNYETRALINTNDLEWENTQNKGIYKKLLSKKENEKTSILKIEENSKLNNDSKINSVEIFVLEGVYKNEFGEFKSGTYLNLPNENEAFVTSSSGCVIFRKENCDKGIENIIIDTNSTPWLKGQGNLEVMPLYTQTALVKWQTQMMKATNGNKYEDAPEFEAFIKKWMDKGESEEHALVRATTYARAGLLDYGKQKVWQIDEKLPYGDIKQHGFHLINNEPLKNAVMKTLDNLSVGDATDLIRSIFDGYPENKGVPSSFQELLDNFGVKLEELKKLNPEEHKNDKYSFTGDVNLKDGTDSKEYNNFIFDTLIKFFEDRIEKFDYYVANKPPEDTPDYHEVRDGLNSLIDNFKKEIAVYNGENNGNK